MSRSALALAALLFAGAAPAVARPRPPSPAGKPGPAPVKVNPPWTIDEIKVALRPGAAFLYRQEAGDGTGKSVDFVKREVIATADSIVFQVTSLDSKKFPTHEPQQNPVEWSDYAARLIQINGTTTSTAENLKTPAGTFACVVLRTRSEPDGKSSTVTWLAKDHPGVVVKMISQIGKMKRVMTLEEYSP